MVRGLASTGPKPESRHDACHQESCQQYPPAPSAR
jgi:hypothetical protein